MAKKVSTRAIGAAALALCLAGGAVWMLFDAPEPSGAADILRRDWTAAVADLAQDGFAAPAPGPLAFPDDHGAHPETRAESWSVLAQLIDETGAAHTLRLEWTRLGLTPPEKQEAGAPWAPNALFRGQIALTSPDATSSEERLSRGALGSAGAGQDIWLDDWTLRVAQGPEARDFALTAKVRGRPIDLRLSPVKPPLSPEAGGESPPFRGYALTRLAVDGAIGDADGATRGVKGVAWFEHAWGALPPPGGPITQDRMVAHLDNGAEIALTRTRRRDGRGTPSVDGFLVGPDASVRAFDAGALSMEVTGLWRDAQGESWPTMWRLETPRMELALEPTAADQRRDFLDPVWTGGVRLDGRIDGEPLSGAGILMISEPSAR